MARGLYSKKEWSEVKKIIVAVYHKMKQERLCKEELNISNAGREGYNKYIAKIMTPYLKKYREHIRKKKYKDEKDFCWHICDLFCTGGLIRRNFSFGKKAIDIYGEDIRGIDRHCAYQYYLGQSCLHSKPLEFDELEPGKKYVEFARYTFNFKMKPQYKDIPLFDKPGETYVNYITEWNNLEVGMSKQKWELFNELADVELIKKEDVYYFEDLGNILEDSMKQFYEDRETLKGDAKLACKAIGCAAVGFLALKPKDGKKRVPFINPMANYWVCERCQIDTLSMIKKIIDSGGKWIQSITDSVYWQGGITYEELDLKDEYGAWDIAIKGKPWRMKTISSGFYGIANKNGKILVAKFSGFGDDSQWCKWIKHFMKDKPLDLWDSIREIKDSFKKSPKYIKNVLNQYELEALESIIQDAERNGCDFSNPIDKMEECLNSGQKVWIDDSRFVASLKIRAAQLREMKKKEKEKEQKGETK